MKYSIDDLLSLAITMHANKGCYALLLGSGVSRSAGIPTAWEILTDLSQRLAALRNENCAPDPITWFQNTFGHPPDYGKLLDQLTKTPTERSLLLRPYFEPTEAELEQGAKQPTAAHKAIAKLVAIGAVKLIITTNFDRLLERALAAEGIVAQVVSTPDAIDGALPLVHASCTIVKLHGDYLDSRTKNAPHELEEYDQRVNQYLDRIFDEFGLIICGWSGDWDVALRAAIERCKGRRFSSYWVTRGTLSEQAKALIKLRAGNVINAKDADSFFTMLEEKIVSLEDISQLHPLSPKVLAATLKRYLVSDQYRIRLEELILSETEQVFDHCFLQVKADPVGQGKLVRQRFHSYRNAMQNLLTAMAVGCYWGNIEQHSIWTDMLSRIASATRLQNAALPTDLKIYPAMLLLYTGGLSAIKAQKFSTLKTILDTPVVQFDGTSQPVAMACCSDSGLHSLAMKAFPSENPHTPLSNLLHSDVRETLREIIPDDDVYDTVFDDFEVFLALSIGELGSELAARGLPTTRMPVGRFGWRRGRNQYALQRLIESESRAGVRWLPYACGFFGANSQLFQKLCQSLQSRVEARFG